MLDLISCCCKSSTSPQGASQSYNCKTVSAPICVLALGAGTVLYFINQTASIATFAGGALVMGLAACYFEKIATQGVENRELSNLTVQMKSDLALIEEARTTGEENEGLVAKALTTFGEIESLSLSSAKTAQNTSQNQSSIQALITSSLVNLGVINPRITSVDSALQASLTLGKNNVASLSNQNKERDIQLEIYDKV